MPLNKNTFATFTKYRTNVMLTLEIWRAFQAYQIYKIWSSFATPNNSFTAVFKSNTEKEIRNGLE